MNCWYCKHEMMWEADHDISEEDEEYSTETNLSCPSCGSFVMIFLPKEGIYDPDKNNT